MSRLPDFIIIGAGKCGTTSLQDYLNQHPQIYICPQKETFFFMPEEPRAKHRSWGAITRFEDYSALFKDAPERSVIGEISTNYYAYPESAQLIYNQIPGVKILAILRDPAERAFSSYQMRVRGGIENDNFDRVIASQNNQHIERGFYYAQLLPYFETFQPENIKICLYDDLCKDSVGFMQDVFRFVGVDDQFIPDMSKRGREGGLPKNKTLNNLLKKPNPLRNSVASVLKLFMPLEVRQKIRNNLLKKNIYKARLSPENRQELIEIYRDDILKLQDLIDRDLSSWLKVGS